MPQRRGQTEESSETNKISKPVSVNANIWNMRWVPILVKIIQSLVMYCASLIMHAVLPKVCQHCSPCFQQFFLKKGQNQAKMATFVLLVPLRLFCYLSHLFILMTQRCRLKIQQNGSMTTIHSHAGNCKIHATQLLNIR